jgi:hypothetical protein
LPHHHQVLLAAQEVAGGQLFDLPVIDGLGVELPIQIGHRTDIRQRRALNSPFDGSLVAAIG